MSSMTLTAVQRTLVWLTDPSNAQPPVLPYELRLLSALGDSNTPGTEVNGGSYAAPDITLSSTTGENTTLVRIDNMPAGPVVGGELWDAAGVRWFHGPLTEERTLNAGDPVELAPGEISIVEAA